MMKKLLVLMLVFGMASLASAGLNISVNGDPNPVDSQITLLPSQTLLLDIYADAAGFSQDTYVGLIAEMAKGVVNGGTGVMHMPPAPDASQLMGWAGVAGVAGMPAGYDGLLVGVASFTIPSPFPYPSGIYFDEIVFHCEGPGDVTLLLGEIDATGTWTGNLFDSVVIHQIVPEPATIALLGFGGLLLRRRRRK